MTLEQNIERIANALEALVDLKSPVKIEGIPGMECAKNPEAPQSQAVAAEKPKAAPKKAAAPKQAEAPKAPEAPKSEAPNPLSDFNPATEFKAPDVAQTPAASTVTHKDVVEKLIAFAKDYGEDQAYSVLASFKVAKVKELANDQLQAVIDKLEKFRSLNL